MVQYINIRRNESKSWLESINCKCDIHYLNIPDQMDLLDFNNNYEKDMFQAINGQGQLSYLMDKIEKIIGDNIILINSFENHPSHKLGFSLGQSVMNKKIYYSVHTTLTKNAVRKEGLYYNRLALLGKDKFFNYYFVYSDKELKQKRNEFQFFYYSQFIDFSKTGLKIRNWEQYISEVPLKLTGEDKTHKISVGES